MGGNSIMMFWGVVIAGPIMAYWIIVIGVFIPPLTPFISFQTILIVLAILECTLYVTNLFNNIIYF